MPYSLEHKQQSREKILKSAIACFTEKGFENTSIDEIMQRAEMTRGAFYAHFSSKSELYQQALLSGAMNSQLLKLKPEEVSDREWVNLLVKGYLSEHHIQQKQPPCPLAFLVTDVAVSEPEVRKTYTKIFKGMNEKIHSMAKSFSDCDESRIYAVTAMLIGAVAIGRALDKRQLRQTMLSGCETLALALLNGEMAEAEQGKKANAD
ncbi:TetR/AcrR family transcriptional regulator [Kaarinaea lacus]